jgi:hypothetical protein
VPCVLDIGTRRRRVVSFTPRPLYTRGKSPRYPLDGRLGGHQSRTRWSREKYLAPAGNRTPEIPIIQAVDSHYTDWVTPENCMFKIIKNHHNLKWKLLRISETPSLGRFNHFVRNYRFMTCCCFHSTLITSETIKEFWQRAPQLCTFFTLSLILNVTW